MRWIWMTMMVMTVGCNKVDPVELDDSGVLCLEGSELRAVLDSCGSTCATVNEASCTLDGDVVTTVYDYTPQKPGEACDASCRIEVATCGTPTGETLTYGGSPVTVADLPACNDAMW